MLPISDSDLQRRSFPYVNISIIVICTLVFLYELFVADQDSFFYQFGLVPIELTQGIDLEFICGNTIYWDTPPGFSSALCDDIHTSSGNWTTMFSSMFMHGDIMHFAGNMLFLWVFGDNVEDNFGHFRYLLFYLAAGIAASWFQIATDTESVIPTIGASGAIAGVLGAYLLLFPLSRVSTLVIFFFITVIRIPAYVLLGFWFILQFIPGMAELGASSQSGGVAYWAHIGGFIVGVAVVAVYKMYKGEPIWPGGRGGYGGPGGYGGGGPREVKYWRGRPIDY